MRESINSTPPPFCRKFCWVFTPCARGRTPDFFNGRTNISSSRFLVFCVKGLDNVAQNLRDTLLFTVLSYMSDQLLTAGNTVAAIDELYLWLTNPTAVTYIRNCLKRVRESGVLPDPGLPESGRFRPAGRPGADSAPLRYPHPSVPVPSRGGGGAILPEPSAAGAL